MAGARNLTVDTQRRFWDWHWQHAEERKAINGWVERRADETLAIVRSLGLGHPKILDFGCGIGWFAGRLTALGSVTGIDLSDEAIARARATVPNVDFIAGNLFQVNLPANHFDIVVSHEVLSHVDNQQQYVARAAMVLKPGGHLILTTSNKFVTDRLGSIRWNIQPPEHISVPLTPSGLKRLLKPHFKVLRLTSILPMGDGGILRLINSTKLTALLGHVASEALITSLKERACLGYQLVTLAQKRL